MIHSRYSNKEISRELIPMLPMPRIIAFQSTVQSDSVMKGCDFNTSNSIDKDAVPLPSETMALVMIKADRIEAFGP